VENCSFINGKYDGKNGKSDQKFKHIFVVSVYGERDDRAFADKNCKKSCKIFGAGWDFALPRPPYAVILLLTKYNRR